MVLVQQKPSVRCCPRCNGFMYLGYEDDYSCLTCGEYIFANAPYPPVVAQPAVPPDGKRKRGRPRKNPVAA